MKRVATMGDPHGCIEEFKQLYNALSWHSLDEIRVLGDFVDRGPDSGAVVQFCRENGIEGILGNHEDAIINLWDRVRIKGLPIKNQDKLRTVMQLSAEDIEWLKNLPKLHIYSDLNLVAVHGGLFPKLELWQQPHNIIRAQMLKPQTDVKSIWWGPDCLVKFKKSEEDFRNEGWERWYRIYDGPWNVVYGHSVFAQPFIHQNDGAGKTIGIDTGSCFGGSLTAMIWDEKQEPVFLSVKAKRHYADKVRFSLSEG